MNISKLNEDIEKLLNETAVSTLLDKHLQLAGYTECGDHFEKFVGDSHGEHVCKIYINNNELEFVNGNIVKKFNIGNDVQIERVFDTISELEIY